MKKRRNLLFLIILLLGIGFAAVSTTLYLNGDINISSNSEDFDVRFTKAVIDSEDKTSEAISEDGKSITYTAKELQALNDKSVLDFEVTNNSSLYDAEVSIECTSGEKKDYYQIIKEVASIIPSKTTEKGSIEVEKIKVTTEDIEESFTCTLTASAKERTTKVVINGNIVNQTLECLKNKVVGSCEAGTEIKYKVNDSTTKTFHVLHDDGDVMTLQQSENTVDGVAWYDAPNLGDNTKGPLTALEALDSATSDWSNVNTISYEMGLTNFNGTNAYTGCSLSGNDWNCTENTYTLGKRSGKVRMITAQEAIELGCNYTPGSCPGWMGSSGYYWTMSTNSADTKIALCLDLYYSALSNYNTPGRDSLFGARAVIEISK